MTEGARRRAILGTLALTVAAGLADQVLVVLNRSTWASPTEIVNSSLPIAAGYGCAGALILWRRPRHAVGRTAMYLAGVGAFSVLAGDYAVYSRVVSHSSLPFDLLAGWIAQWTFYIAFPAAAAMMFLFFPDGVPRRRRWWPVIGMAMVAALALTMGFMLAPGPVVAGSKHYGLDIGLTNPTGILSADASDALQGIGWGLSVLTLLLAVLAVALRFRGADPERRQQLKWLAYCALPVAPAFAIHFMLLQFNVDLPDITKPVYTLAFIVGVPAAMAIAVLKYRLYEIDAVVSRAVVYGSLAAFVSAVYVAIVVGVGTFVGSGGRPNLLLSIVATAIVAVAFQPVRERVQKLANRMVYGRRATPYEVLSDFSSRVADSYASDAVLSRMAQVLAEGTGADRAAVWLRAGDTIRPAAAWPALAAPEQSILGVSGQILPQIPGADRTVAVRHQGELLGALTVKKRPGESLTPIEEKLLDDLAHQAGLVLKNVGLTADLQARLNDLRGSRKRLVAAQDEERRRLERNLHDGAQQHLVALKVKLGLAEMLLDRDPIKAQATIQQLKGDADEALETLRDLARGIYPPLLADKGLVPALEAQARKATVPVDVVADGVGRYSQEVEAAVYFCCLEALQNVQKYAAAAHVAVRLQGAPGGLQFEVRDDGAGFDPSTVRRGAGLQNMEDRLASLGGSLEVAASPGRGATLRGWLPRLDPVPAG